MTGDKPPGTLRRWAARLERETFAVYLAGRDPRTPWYAKALAVCIVAYALSPLDLIPDFIPVLGYVDDLVLVPLGLALAIKLIPDDVLRECRDSADAGMSQYGSARRTATVVVVVVWILLLAVLGVVIWRIAS